MQSQATTRTTDDVAADTGVSEFAYMTRDGHWNVCFKDTKNEYGSSLSQA